MIARDQYGAAHREVREQWRPRVDRGEAWCSEPVCIEASRWIAPGTAWDLAHDRELGGYRGPAHARCNRGEGGRHRAAMQRARAGLPDVPAPAWSSRRW